jgi:ABC-2 type transport system permease protein
MRPLDLVRRELRLVFGARVTWLVAAASALLVGHSFVLAIDLYSAASQSAVGFGLMQRQMDPLAGIVRPVLGALHLATALLVPVIASRPLAAEKERRSYGALALAVGGTTRVLLAKMLAAFAGTSLLVLPPVVLLGLFAVLGGHVDLIETTVAIAGHVLHLFAFTAVAIAAAAASRTVAQATTIAVAVSLASWAVEAGEGFAALAWLGGLEWMSVSQQLERFELGVIPLGGTVWFLVLTTTAFAVAIVLARIDVAVRRFGPAAMVLAAGVIGLWSASAIPHAYDWSEQRRVSLPPGVVDALRTIDAPLRVEVWLDREDGTRHQLESSVLDRLRLARPDLVVDTPFDRETVVEHDDDYGRIVIQVGEGTRETRSTSRKEFLVLVFEAAGRPMPEWEPPVYAGYPMVVEGGRRAIATLVAYALLPLGHLLVAVVALRIRRRTS